MSRREGGGAHGRRSQVLAEFQAQIPDPLGQDLETFLSTGGMRNPTVSILLGVFIGQHGFKGAAMQIELQHIFGAEGGQGQRRDEEFVDHLPSLLAHRGGS